MTIGFNIEYPDILAFTRHYVKTDKTVRRTWRILIWGLPIVLFVIILAEFHHGKNLAGEITRWMAASGLWVVLVSFLSRRSHVRMAKKMVNNPENANLLDYREMTFLDDSIESKNARSNTRMSWETIVKLADTSTHFLLYTGANQAIIIPKEKITAKDVEALQSLFKAHNLL